MAGSRNGVVRYGIVGTGMIARIHAQAIENAENSRLVAVHDVVPEKAAAFARECGVDWDSDLGAFLGRSDIDAVTVATPSGVRADVAVPAARAGKHLLCEKPLEITVERARRIVEASRESGTLLACVFQARTTRAVTRIKAAVDQGRFGRLVMASVQVPWYRTQAYYDGSPWRGTWRLDGGGALMNQSIHIIDLLVYFMGDPESVSAYTGRLAHRNIEVEDTAVAAVRFKNGALATISATTGAAPGFPRRLELCGTDGSAVLVDDRLERWQFAEQTDVDDAVLIEGHRGEGIQGGASNPTDISSEGHRRQIADLTRAILEGGTPMVCGDEAIRAVSLIRGIYNSAEHGRPCVFE